MQLSNEDKAGVKKLALAVFMLALLTVFIGYKMEIDLTLKVVVLGIASLFGLVILVASFAALGQGFNQFMLRHGATDAQWFYFNNEPKGLVEMREQLRQNPDK